MKDVAIHKHDFVHPMDRELSERIVNLPLVKQLLDVVFKENLDNVNFYLYNSSCLRLPTDHIAVVGFHAGCQRFGVEVPEYVYVVRSYDFDVKVVGYSEPVVLVSSRLLLEGDESLISGRTAAAAAAIAAGHHKLEFLLWIYENFSGLIGIPVLNMAAESLISEWNRSRQYTLDRAFLLFTQNYPLSLKNILYGIVPEEVLDRFIFGEDDTYSVQVKEFYRKETAIDILTSIYSVLQYEIWIPARYEELRKYYTGGAWNDLAL